MRQTSAVNDGTWWVPEILVDECGGVVIERLSPQPTEGLAALVLQGVRMAGLNECPYYTRITPVDGDAMTSAFKLGGQLAVDELVDAVSWQYWEEGI